MANRTITHSPIVDFHRIIAAAHVGINGFYRFNWAEITGQFRAGIGMPALLLESHSSDMQSATHNVTNFNSRSISFMLLDFAGQQNNFVRQEEVLDRLENVALDICAYLVCENKKRDSFLYGMFDVNSYRMEKVGPIFDNMYGWNVMYELKNHEPMIFNPDKWNFPADSE